jgi:hypothetical protein
VLPHNCLAISLGAYCYSNGLPIVVTRLRGKVFTGRCIETALLLLLPAYLLPREYVYRSDDSQWITFRHNILLMFRPCVLYVLSILSALFINRIIVGRAIQCYCYHLLSLLLFSQGGTTFHTRTKWQVESTYLYVVVGIRNAERQGPNLGPGDSAQGNLFWTGSTETLMWNGIGWRATCRSSRKRRNIRRIIFRSSHCMKASKEKSVLMSQAWVPLRLLGVESNWVHSARRSLIGLLYPAPGDYDDGEFGGMKIDRGNRSTRRTPPPSATLSTTNPNWTDPGSNLGRHGGKLATNHLSYGAAIAHSVT